LEVSENASDEEIFKVLTKMNNEATLAAGTPSFDKINKKFLEVSEAVSILMEVKQKEEKEQERIREENRKRENNNQNETFIECCCTRGDKKLELTDEEKRKV